MRPAWNLAVFVRFWLNSTPPLLDSVLAAAQLKVREHYDGFVEALGQRLVRGSKLADEASHDMRAAAAEVDVHLRYLTPAILRCRL